MNSKIILYLLLVNQMTSTCTTGCLRCETSNAVNVCVLCDITNNYYMGTNTCVEVTAANHC